MKIYRVGPLDDGDMFFPAKNEAIKEAEFYGVEHIHVTEIEIGRLTKRRACDMASGRNYAKSQKIIWGTV